VAILNQPKILIVAREFDILFNKNETIVVMIITFCLYWIGIKQINIDRCVNLCVAGYAQSCASTAFT